MVGGQSPFVSPCGQLSARVRSKASWRLDHQLARRNWKSAKQELLDLAGSANCSGYPRYECKSHGPKEERTLPAKVLATEETAESPPLSTDPILRPDREVRDATHRNRGGLQGAEGRAEVLESRALDGLGKILQWRSVGSAQHRPAQVGQRRSSIGIAQHRAVKCAFTLKASRPSLKRSCPGAGR
jgi:hypothetical protein